MPTQNAILQATESAILEILSGDLRGQAFEIRSERVAIGRSENNDIILATEGVSRFHAVIEKQDNGAFMVRDNRSKNGVLVNGVPVQQQVLSSGDLVQIGSVGIRFKISGSVGSQGNFQLAEPAAHDLADAPGVPGTPWAEGSKAPRSKRPLIYGIGGAVLLYVLYTNNNPSVEAPQENEKSTETVLKAPDLPQGLKDGKLPGLEDPTLSKAEQEIAKFDFSNSPVKEAEQHYKRGQREFSNKNYHRAIEAFSTTLSLNRSHPLAEYYLRLAIYESESEAKRNYNIGVKYFESLQYARAMGHFKQAMLHMQHRPADKLNADAAKYIEQCKKRLQAAELFP